jgi:hypothetical protein
MSRKVSMLFAALIAASGWALFAGAVPAQADDCEWTLDVPATGGTMSKCYDSNGDDYLLNCGPDPDDCQKIY